MNVPSALTADLDRRGDNELLTLSETAAILRVPVNTVRYWRQLGTGPSFFKIGRHLVTTAADLRGWIAEQRTGAGVV
ncbi:DNA-binding protein [Nocardioides mangrovicus]|uniref:DNA-binding protein n=1 Tax=Nocardioides mangrovicus TaxID=2478913 RepID=A0A3L8P4Q4_9ACTN|nr:helix-turn-helix domain-containing protein [Nocardioides mangrovicus]RLV49723.1 DNA-binding protein [Nocardioides mangrovicus]